MSHSKCHHMTEKKIKTKHSSCTECSICLKNILTAGILCMVPHITLNFSKFRTACFTLLFSKFSFEGTCHLSIHQSHLLQTLSLHTLPLQFKTSRVGIYFPNTIFELVNCFSSNFLTSGNSRFQDAFKTIYFLSLDKQVSVEREPGNPCLGIMAGAACSPHPGASPALDAGFLFHIPNKGCSVPAQMGILTHLPTSFSLHFLY